MPKESSSSSSPVRDSDLQASSLPLPRRIVFGLRRVVQELELPSPLPDAERRAMLYGTAAAPELLQLSIAAVTDNPALFGGVFDMDGVLAARDRLAHLEEIAFEMSMLSKQVTDEVLRLRAKTGTEGLAVYTALRGLVRSPRGKHLSHLFRRMQTAARAWTRPHPARGSKAERDSAPVVEGPEATP